MSLPSLFPFLTNSPLVLFTSPDGYIFSTLSTLCHRVQRRRALQWSFALKVISLNVHASCCASRAIQRVELLVREKGKRKRKYKRGRSRAWNNCTDFSFDYPLTVHNHHHHYQYFTTTLFCHHGSLVSFFTFFLLSVLWISLTKQNETKRNWATRLRDTSLRSMKPFFSLFYTSFSTFFYQHGIRANVNRLLIRTLFPFFLSYVFILITYIRTSIIACLSNENKNSILLTWRYSCVDMNTNSYGNLWRNKYRIFWKPLITIIINHHRMFRWNFIFFFFTLQCIFEIKAACFV